MNLCPARIIGAEGRGEPACSFSQTETHTANPTTQYKPRSTNRNRPGCVDVLVRPLQRLSRHVQISTRDWHVIQRHVSAKRYLGIVIYLLRLLLISSCPALLLSCRASRFLQSCALCFVLLCCYCSWLSTMATLSDFVDFSQSSLHGRSDIMPSVRSALLTTWIVQ